MIPNPTTDQLLADAARELAELILPAVDDPGVQVAVEMLEQLVRSCSVRAAHEIAWMHDQIAELEAFCADAVTAMPDAEGLAAALTEHQEAGVASLHLADVVAAYNRISDVTSSAMEAAFAAGETELQQRAGTLMRTRMELEGEIRGEFRMPGRG
ncbi:MAG: hypothetical protein AAGA99_23900 [Actinomycetota bacterium]